MTARTSEPIRCALCGGPWDDGTLPRGACVAGCGSWTEAERADALAWHAEQARTLTGARRAVWAALLKMPRGRASIRDALVSRHLERARELVEALDRLDRLISRDRRARARTETERRYLEQKRGDE